MNEVISKAVESFINFKKVSGMSPRTIADYERHLSCFIARIPKHTEDYKAAVFSYLSDNIAPNTHNLRFAYLKCFFSWCTEEGIIKTPHPMKGLKKRKPTSRIINIDNKKISELLQLPDKSTFAGLRDYALILFSIDTGVRPNEALSLRTPDFNFSQSIVRIPAAVAKTRQERVIPISQQTAETVKKLLSVHHKEWDSPPVFCSSCGKQLTGTAWTHILKRYGMGITPYCLRHVAALGLLRQGMSAFHLQRILGHSNISMTQRYVSLQLDDLKKSHEANNFLSVVSPPVPKLHRVGKIS